MRKDKPIPAGVPLVVACEMVHDLELATAEEHRAQESPRVEMVVLEEHQQVVQLDGDAWERAATQKQRPHRTPQEDDATSTTAN